MVKFAINLAVFVSLAITNPTPPISTESSCYRGWYKDYHIGALEAYRRADMSLGQLAPLENHSCTGWDPGFWDNKVVVRPLYNDTGLPVYEIFREELFELVGFEFRIWDPCMRKGWGGYNGFSTTLSDEEDFIWQVWP